MANSLEMYGYSRGTHGQIHRFAMEQHGHSSKTYRIDHGNPMGFSWNTHVLSMAILKTPRGNPMYCPWEIHGNPLVFCGFFIVDITKPWSYPKNPLKKSMILTMKSQWYSHVFSMVLTMNPPWSSMGTGPWIFHGKHMEYFCKGKPGTLAATSIPDISFVIAIYLCIR